MTSPDTVVRLTGLDWQSYLVFGQSSTLSLVDARGGSDPSVTHLSGAVVSARRAATGAIEMSVQSSSMSLLVASYKEFSVLSD